MKPERWQQVERLCQAALDRAPGQRAAFIVEACAEDVELRREVESLLAYQAQAEPFIETPALQVAAGMLNVEEPQALVGQNFSHYQILALLGRGGMGEVYLAQDEQLRRKVALKVLPAAFTQDAERVRRFEQEARAASALNHPNIITIYEIGQTSSAEGGVRYIATEFVEGETLRQQMAGSPMELRRTLELVTQVAAALAEAHEAGIVHRDIKPENVMVRRDGLVKVLDFGLAKLTARPVEAHDSDAPTAPHMSTAPGVVMGTLQYMSPEQARGQEVDARTDIFSFGAVLYELLTRQSPFAGATPSDVIAAVLKSEPAPLSSCVPAVPRELERIVSKALRKERAERYQTSQDLLLDLKSLGQELEVSAKESAVTSGAVTAATQRTSVAGQLNQAKRHRLSLVLALVAMLIVLASLGYWAWGSKAIDSVVVLPLVNAGNDPNVEYLSDGIAEALINSLTELQQLKVIARSTAFRYKGKDVDPQAIGRELKVRAVLMGRVRQVGDALNVQMDLVDAQTGAQLWGNEYGGKLSEVLAVKQTIASAVTEKLRLRLSGEDKLRLAKQETRDAEAYQFYLKGRYFWNKRGVDELKKAITQFQQALDRDPNFALGYIGLADCYHLLEGYAGMPASETLPKAKAAADRALQLDDSLAEAHTSSASAYEKMWRWAEAEGEYKRAISLNPNYPTAHQWYAGYLQKKRQFDSALGEAKRAQQLDPLSPIINDHVAWLHLLRNDLAAGIEQCQRNLELNPNFPGTHYLLGLAYFKQQRYGEATAEFQQAVELSGRTGQWLAPLGYCYAVSGRRAEALAVLKELEEKYARHEALGQHLAAVCAGLGEKDQAFAWLERDFEQRSGYLPSITYSFSFEGMHNDSRYASLVRRMGLEP